MLVSAVLLALAVPAAFATKEKSTAHAVPDITVIMGATGGAIGKANVYLDGNLAGTTDSKGNLTFKEAPAAGNHTVLVSAKGINNVTVITDFSTKPAVIKAESTKGKNLTVHVTDKNSKQGVAGVSIYNGKYRMGMTDDKGYFNVTNFPSSLYIVKLEKDGYKNTTTLLVVFSNTTQKFSLSPR